MSVLRDMPAIGPNIRTPGGDVRLCGRCGRPVTALSREEYTPERARLIAERGLCVCRPGADAWLVRQRRR
jgi:hypothetical protein